MASASFPKREHIVSNRLIETLFSSGSTSMAAYPLRSVFRKVPRSQTDVPVQVLMSVSKKRFKHAVDRNRVKRQLREAYRHHKQSLCETVPADESLLVAFVWISDDLLPSTRINDSMQRLLQRIAEKI